MRKRPSHQQHLAVSHGRQEAAGSNSLLSIRCGGFTLLELIITLTVLTIMTLGVMPLVKMSVRRQREQRLRDDLRMMRLAIKEFHRDTMGSPCTGATTTGDSSGGGIMPRPNDPRNPGAGQAPADPRSRVVITDCKIFTVDNPDRYPPDLETLVNGVNITPRGGGANTLGGAGLRDSKTTATTVNEEASTKKKVYLRQIPVDPITGEADWEFRSSYDLPDAASWGKENVFDVRSKARGTALNGEKYSDW